jgi:hypothetical protein
MVQKAPALRANLKMSLRKLGAPRKLGVQKFSRLGTDKLQTAVMNYS